MCLKKLDQCLWTHLWVNSLKCFDIHGTIPHFFDQDIKITPASETLAKNREVTSRKPTASFVRGVLAWLLVFLRLVYYPCEAGSLELIDSNLCSVFLFSIIKVNETGVFFVCFFFGLFVCLFFFATSSESTQTLFKSARSDGGWRWGAKGQHLARGKRKPTLT